MLDTLRGKGLDISATNRHNQGSPLAYALCQSNIQLVEYLVDAKAKINSYAYGANAPQVFWNLVLKDVIFQSLLEPGYFGKIAPIHVAVASGHEGIVSYLFSNGASPDTPGSMFPIQFAAVSGYVEITRMLLRAGSNPNSISQPDPAYKDDFFDFQRVQMYNCKEKRNSNSTRKRRRGTLRNFT